jgi:hypothetical protein
MTPDKASELKKKIAQLQGLMTAYSTDGRRPEQPHEYEELYREVALDLEDAKYGNPNPYKSLEVFYGYVRSEELKTYASRRTCISKLYEDLLLELSRAERQEKPSKVWAKANDALEDELALVRVQWLKARNFIQSNTPDFENSVKESISCVESTLRILLQQPKATLGNLLKEANLDSDIERLISQAYGYASNRDAVRHGGTKPSTLTKVEAEFFLELAGSSIAYITARLKSNGGSDA